MTRKGNGKAQEFYRSALEYEGDECLIWPYCTVDGYGAMTREGKKVIVSRVLCEETRGRAPFRHEAAHSCGVRRCVNKNHLSWKTSADNNRDKIIHGTVPKGEGHWSSKLTERSVVEILSAKGRRPAVDLAEEFGVSPTTISSIHSRRTWAYIEVSA